MPANFTGSLSISGSLLINGSQVTPGGGGGSTDTGSLMLTGSVSGNILTFTKGNGSTFNLAVSAVGTGSAFPYVGNASIDGALTLTGSLKNNVWPISVTNGTASLDLSKGNAFSITLTSSAATFFSASNIQPNQKVSVRVTQGASQFNSYGNAYFATNFFFPNGTEYVPTLVSGAVDLVEFETYSNSVVYAGAYKNIQASEAFRPPTPGQFISASGGEIVTSGSYLYHIFTASGDFIVYSTGSVTSNIELFGVAGGGRGVYGGGGAGGIFYSSSYTVTSSATNAIVVGGPGEGGDGGDTVAFTFTAIGGGETYAITPNTGSGTPGQGFNGGASLISGSQVCGGGGGSSQIGEATFISSSLYYPGDGGSGSQYSQFATIGGVNYGTPAGWFAAGGGGGNFTGTEYTSSGGFGGGGNGGAFTTEASFATGYGSGGGGRGDAGSLRGGTGGIVIIKYQYNN